MKRQIKFRAWHTEQKRMFEVYGLGIDFVTENTLDRVDPGTNAFYGDDMNFIEIMQWTSLKTIVRKDGFTSEGEWKTTPYLYEGDVVEFTSETSFYTGLELLGKRYVCVFQAELGGGFVLKHVSTFKIQNGCNEIRNGYRVIDPYTMSNLITHFEIIGNIYQNPELYEKETQHPQSITNPYQKEE